MYVLFIYKYIFEVHITCTHNCTNYIHIYVCRHEFNINYSKGYYQTMKYKKKQHWKNSIFLHQNHPYNILKQLVLAGNLRFKPGSFSLQAQMFDGYIKLFSVI